MDYPLERLAAWLRRHPVAVDAGIAGLLWCTVVLLPAGTWIAYESLALTFGTLVIAPLARRRAPIPVAAAVTVVGPLELKVLPEFLPANVAALVHALVAYAPRWAGLAGLELGLFGALLVATFYYAASAGSQDLVLVTGAIAVAVVAAWALGDLRRARLQREAGLEERARLLEIERDQEMRLAATAAPTSSAGTTRPARRSPASR